MSCIRRPSSIISTVKTWIAVKQGIITVRAAFSDFHLTLDDQIAEGDKLVSRWTARGVHSGVFLGVPATGKHVEVTGIGISRFENGKIVEAWSLTDFLGLLRQMGALQGFSGTRGNPDRHVNDHLSTRRKP